MAHEQNKNTKCAIDNSTRDREWVREGEGERKSAWVWERQIDPCDS